MIQNILILLNSNYFYNKSELIEIAKGKYKAPDSIKEAYKLAKRKQKWQ